MKIKPLHDRVIVERLEEQGTSKGGIIIPDSAQEKPMEGKIHAVGTGKVDDKGKAIPMAVKKGDRVLFGKYSGTDRTIPRTRAALIDSSIPAISIVPPNRSDVPIGVTATRASVKIEQICGFSTGRSRVTL